MTLTGYRLSSKIFYSIHRSKKFLKQLCRSLTESITLQKQLLLL